MFTVYFVLWISSTLHREEKSLTIIKLLSLYCSSFCPIYICTPLLPAITGWQKTNSTMVNTSNRAILPHCIKLLSLTNQDCYSFSSQTITQYRSLKCCFIGNSEMSLVYRQQIYPWSIKEWISFCEDSISWKWSCPACRSCYSFHRH